MWQRNAKSKRNAYGVATIRRATYNTQNGFSVKGGWWAISADVRKRDRGLCVPCARRGKRVPGKEVHHIVPLSRGGKTVMSNLMLICEACHNQRHNHLYRKR